MIVWRITGNRVGPDDCGAYYFATKAEALHCKREWDSDEGGTGNVVHGPERIEIKTRDDLAWHLNNAMGFGVS